jgi:hypothetical protein
MDFEDYIKGIRFRFLKPHVKRPRGVRRLSRLLARLGWHFEIANTRLPEGHREMCNLLKPLCCLPRMSTFAVGAIVNRAVSEMPVGQSFVNVGVWHGFTFFSGMAGHSKKSCIGVDNFSHRGSPRDQFLKRLDRLGSGLHQFHEFDFRDYFRDVHSTPIGVYLFDGPHTYRDHYEAMELAEPFFAPGCLIIMDDSNWSQVREATDDFLSRSPNRYERLLDVRTPASGHPTFWNGLVVLRMTGQKQSTIQPTANRVCPENTTAC